MYNDTYRRVQYSGTVLDTKIKINDGHPYYGHPFSLPILIWRKMSKQVVVESGTVNFSRTYDEEFTHNWRKMSYTYKEIRTKSHQHVLKDKKLLKKFVDNKFLWSDPSVEGTFLFINEVSDPQEFTSCPRRTSSTYRVSMSGVLRTPYGIDLPVNEYVNPCPW